LARSICRKTLLREPLRPEHIKPRLLGHWGTSPGLSFIYAHLNRLIQSRRSDAEACRAGVAHHEFMVGGANLTMCGQQNDNSLQTTKDMYLKLFKCLKEYKHDSDRHDWFRPAPIHSAV
jgi:phosphoketolase